MHSKSSMSFRGSEATDESGSRAIFWILRFARYDIFAAFETAQYIRYKAQEVFPDFL